MTQLHLEKAAHVVLLTVPPIEGAEVLERALTSYRVSKGLKWPTLSRTEPTVLELPLLRWKSILYVLSEVFYVTQLIVRNLEHPQAEDKLEFVLDNKSYPNVSALPKEALRINVGAFELKNTWLRVSDPCYDKDVGCAFRLNARPGTWKSIAELDDGGVYGFQVARLTVAHADITGDLEYGKFELTTKEAGVDSGICGFFDDTVYPKERNRQNPVLDTFYRGICDRLVSRAGAPDSPVIIAPGECGAASLTYDGDGTYVCRTLKDENGKVVAAYLWFAPYADPHFPDEGDYDDEELDEEE